MRVLRVVAALLALASLTKTAKADEDRDLMGAASMVLAGASQRAGAVVVRDGESAYLRSTIPNDVPIVFERLARCIYVEKIGEQGDQFVMIDFSKLTGEWVGNGPDLDFRAAGTAHCFKISEHEKGCWQGRLHIITGQDLERRHLIVDRVDFMLDHGCRSAHPE